MLNNKILFYRNVFSLVRALISNIFHFDKLSIKIFETYATFRKIFINFMRAREFINKPTIQKQYHKIANSLYPDLVVYLRNQPQDQEFEKIIQDMTLANFTNETVDVFVSEIFSGKSKVGGHGKSNNNGGGGGYQAKTHDVPFTNGPGNNNMVPQQPPHIPPNPGYPNQGYPNQGYPNQGYPNQGYPNQGFPNQGYPNQGNNAPNYPPQPPYGHSPGPAKPHNEFPIEDTPQGPANDYGMNAQNPPSEKPVENKGPDNQLAKMSDEKFDAALDEFINGLKDL